MRNYFARRKCKSCGTRGQLHLAFFDTKHKPLLFVNKDKVIDSWDRMKYFVTNNSHYYVLQEDEYGSKPITAKRFIEDIECRYIDGLLTNKDYYDNVYEDEDGYEFKEE